MCSLRFDNEKNKFLWSNIGVTVLILNKSVFFTMSSNVAMNAS